MQPLRRLAAAALVLCLAATPALADRAGRVMELLRLDELIGIMREEGMQHGAEVGEAFLGPEAGAGWAATVERIYDPAGMAARMRAGLEGALPDDPALREGIAAFFGSDLGRRVVELELSARRAMLDPAIEEAARDAWDDMAADGGARVEAVRRFVAVGDLVEQNVVGGLNATWAFYAGLRDSGAGMQGMSEADMLADVWSQQDAIRTEIDGWLHGYLALAYGPLSEAELDAYVDFFDSPAGAALNGALFAGFNGMFEAVSRALGRAAGGRMLGEDL